MKSDPSESKPVCLSRRQMKKIEEHVGRFVGDDAMVLHEIVSPDIHLDVLSFPSTDRRCFKAFITMGMSAAPMAVPKGYPGDARAELCLILPADWPTDQASMMREDQKFYWPIGALKHIARIPISSETYLASGHTVRESDPPEPINQWCDFVGWLVVPQMFFNEKFDVLKSLLFRVRFLQIIPLYREEMTLALNNQTDDLLERFESRNVDPASLCDPKRVNAGL